MSPPYVECILRAMSFFHFPVPVQDGPAVRLFAPDFFVTFSLFCRGHLFFWSFFLVSGAPAGGKENVRKVLDSNPALLLSTMEAVRA